MSRLDDIRARLEKSRVITPDDIEEVLDWLTDIQKRAAPLRYAVSHLQSGTEKDATISADVGYMYADDEDRILNLTDLTALVFGIYYGDKA